MGKKSWNDVIGELIEQPSQVAEPVTTTISLAELARLRAVDAASKDFLRAWAENESSSEGMSGVMLDTYDAVGKLSQAAKGTLPVDPLVERIRVLEAALRAITARDTGGEVLDTSEPFAYDGMDASDGYSAGLTAADRACADIAREALKSTTAG